MAKGHSGLVATITAVIAFAMAEQAPNAGRSLAEPSGLTKMTCSHLEHRRLVKSSR